MSTVCSYGGVDCSKRGGGGGAIMEPERACRWRVLDQFDECLVQFELNAGVVQLRNLVGTGKVDTRYQRA